MCFCYDACNCHGCWHHYPLLNQRYCLAGKVSVEKDSFQIELDVHCFKHNELSVKTLDNIIVAEGKKEEKGSTLYCVTKHFTRKYKLPNGFDPEMVEAKLTKDSILIITSKVPENIPEVKERTIQIENLGAKQVESKQEPVPEPESNDKNNDE